MARVGIAITKSIAFRDATQEFSNVYYYENGGGLPTEAQANAMVDEIVAEEKSFHSTLVSFIRSRVWSQVGTPSQNQMIAQKTLSGTGSNAPVANFDRERAYLVRWRAGSDSRGNPVYLRKWYHSCGNGPGNFAPPTAVLENTSGFSQASRDSIATAANAVVVVNAGNGPWSLVGKGGRQTDTGFCTAHKYLEHRQLGDMWRG